MSPPSPSPTAFGENPRPQPDRSQTAARLPSRAPPVHVVPVPTTHRAPEPSRKKSRRTSRIAARPAVEPMSVMHPVTWVVRTWEVQTEPKTGIASSDRSLDGELNGPDLAKAMLVERPSRTSGGKRRNETKLSTNSAWKAGSFGEAPVGRPPTRPTQPGSDDGRTINQIELKNRSGEVGSWRISPLHPCGAIASFFERSYPLKHSLSLSPRPQTFLAQVPRLQSAWYTWRSEGPKPWPPRRARTERSTEGAHAEEQAY